MRRAFPILVAALAVAAGYFLWVWANPTPEQAVRKQLEKLAETLAIKPNEGNIARVGAINRTLGFFTEDIVVNGEGIAQVNESIQGRTELQQALFAARQRMSGAVTFHEIRVAVEPGEIEATAEFTAVAELSGQGDPYHQNIKATLKKVEGDWLIQRVDPVMLPLTAPEGN